MPAVVVQSIANLWTRLDAPVRLWTTREVRLRFRQCARSWRRHHDGWAASPTCRSSRLRQAPGHHPSAATKEANPADQLSECPFKVA